MEALARAELKKLIAPYVAECGSALYVWDPSPFTAAVRERMKEPVHIVQFEYRVEPDPVSPADDFNGIRWHGDVLLFARVFRRATAITTTSDDWAVTGWNKAVDGSLGPVIGLLGAERGNNREYIAGRFFRTRVVIPTRGEPMLTPGGQPEWIPMTMTCADLAKIPARLPDGQWYAPPDGIKPHFD